MFPYSTLSLVRFWIHAHASVYVAFGRFLLLFLLFSTVPCIWQSLVRCWFAQGVRMSTFWENTSGYAVFSASWFDSGYVIVSLRRRWYCFRAQRGTCYASVTEFSCCYDAPRAVFLRGFQALMRGTVCGSAVAVHQGRRHPCRNAEADRSGQSDRRPCCAGRAASWVVVQTCRKLWRFPHLVKVIRPYPQLPFFAGRRFPCRGAEADSHGLACS